MTPNTAPELAAWLHIGPVDNDPDPCEAAIGVQRLHTAKASERLRRNSVSLSFLPRHLAVAIGGAIAQVTSIDYTHAVDAVLAGLEAGGNFTLPLAIGMEATIFPADPASGCNRHRDAPVARKFAS